jgi:hypothetical protein
MPHLIDVRRVRAARTGLYSLPLTEPSGGLARSPDIDCNLHHPLELSPLLLFGDDEEIKSPETALGTYRELVQWKVFRGIIDTPLQEFPVLDIWTLCGHQSDDCNRSFSDVPEGLEPARSLVIVFKKKSVVFKL